LFPKPDYFFGSPVTCTPADQAPCASNTLASAARFAWDHGYYAPTIDITWVGFVGPGVANLGLDGPEADDGPGHPRPERRRHGPGVQHRRDVGRPARHPADAPVAGGLQDSYVDDGRVLSEIVTDPNDAIAGSNYTDLAECYKQLNAGVGEFATNTLIADTKALKSGGGGGDGLFNSTQKRLSKLLAQRDALATELKNALFDAAFQGRGTPRLGHAAGQVRIAPGPCRGIGGGLVPVRQPGRTGVSSAMSHEPRQRAATRSARPRGSCACRRGAWPRLPTRGPAARREAAWNSSAAVSRPLRRVTTTSSDAPGMPGTL
jgi:hypothetical protein